MTNRLFWPIVALIVLSMPACRIAIGIDKASAAQVEPQSNPTVTANDTQVTLPTLPPLQAVETEEVSSFISPQEVAATVAPLPTPIAAVPTSSPNPTSTPLIPAQSPPTRIVVPKIGLDAPVEVMSWKIVNQGAAESSVWMIPDNAAGWHRNSALPGQGSNIVLSGHHNLGAEVFRNLVDLQKGDEIILKADGRDYRYVVVDHFILPERGASEEQRHQNAHWIMPTTDERLTLVTCWPYNDNSHRLIVVAK